MKKNKAAQALGRKRWAKIPIKQRSKMVPRTGGRPREYPKCPRYGAHRFSPTTDRCPCGYVRDQKEK